MFTVYILKSLKDNKRYIGCTNDLKRRLFEHNNGLVISTRNRKPFELIFTEEFENKELAMAREKFFKSGKGREFLKSKNL
jgi:putative endonuclease